MKLLLHTMTRLFARCNHDKFVTLRFLSMAEVDCWCIMMLEINKHAIWVQLHVSVTDHKCSIGISLIFDTVLRYWVSLNVFLFFEFNVFWRENDVTKLTAKLKFLRYGKIYK